MMTEAQLREHLEHILAAGSELSDILGIVLARALDDSLDEEDVRQVRQGILSWQRIHGSSVVMLGH